MTRSQQVAADLTALLRARAPLLWIVSREEQRVERYVAQAAEAARYSIATWDVAAGFSDATGKPSKEPEGSRDPSVALDYIRSMADSGPRGLWVLRDFPTWLAGQGGAATLRQLRNLARALPDAQLANAQAVVVLSPGGDVPPELLNHVTVIEWPLPDREEIGEVLDEAVRSGGEKIEPLNGNRETAIDAAVGLSEAEAIACFNRSLVQHRKIDPVTVAGEKKRIIAREGVLEWYDPLPGGLDAVGGLEALKAWLRKRSLAYSPEARAYGLPSPKGVVLVGVPGGGKSMIAKAIGTTWGCPVLRCDLAAQKSKFVGDSEQKIRRAFQVADAMGRCIFWVDEIDKAMQGATSGSSDGGTSADQLGALLNWMQERTSQAFVIATANDVSALPPELLRKGRFDEVWFVDLPLAAEREQIVKATLKTLKQPVLSIDTAEIARVTEGFTGAEIAGVVPEAMFSAFEDKARELSTEDIADVVRTVVPMSKSAKTRIDAIREWGSRNARAAGRPEEKTAEKRLRALDII